MRLEQLRYFIEVAKYHSIGIVAEKWYVTQPNISIAIKNLEKELDCTLFERSKNGMYLTPTGRGVYEKAEAILALADDIYALTKTKETRQKKLSGSFCVLSAPVVMYSFLQDAVLAFLGHQPEVQMMLKECSAEQVFRSVSEKACDLGVTMLSDKNMAQVQKCTGIVCRKILTEKIYVVAGSQFGLGVKKSINCSEISKFPLAVPAPLHMDFRSNKEQAADLEMHVVLCSYSFDLIKALVFSGKAIGLIPNSLIHRLENSDGIDIIPISDLDYGNVCCLYREDCAKLEIIAAFEAELLKFC